MLSSYKNEKRPSQFSFSYTQKYLKLTLYYSITYEQRYDNIKCLA